MTAASRCMSQPFLENINAWKTALPDYSFFLHDTDAMDSYFQRMNDDYEDHLGFPFMTLFLPCLTGAGAGLADIWRYMLLFEYGGLYVDTDDAPGDKIEETLNSLPQADEILVQYDRYYVSQNFFVVKPRHPLLRFALLQVMFNLLHLTDVGSQAVALITGPPAMGKAYHKFMGYYNFEPTDEAEYKFWWPGQYVGHETNWTVTIVADWKNSSRIERMSAVPLSAKKEYYNIVGSVDYSRVYKHTNLRSDPCFARIANALETKWEERMG